MLCQGITPVFCGDLCNLAVKLTNRHRQQDPVKYLLAIDLTDSSGQSRNMEEDVLWSYVELRAFHAFGFLKIGLGLQSFLSS